jgi:uroporphyrinogen-III synthase
VRAYEESDCVRRDRGTAYLTIQRQSRQRRKSKREIAEAIILGDELRRGKGGS